MLNYLPSTAIRGRPSIKAGRTARQGASPSTRNLATSTESDFLEILQRSRDREYSVSVKRTRLSN